MAHIHRAARLGQYDEVGTTLAAGENVNAVSIQHFTPLMLASREGHADIVRLLLKAGADPGIAHPNGRTPLDFAASDGRLEVVGLLLSHGADPNALSSRGDTPMIAAAHFCHRDVVDLLMQDGADASVKDKRGRTAADWLACGGVIGDSGDMIALYQKFKEDNIERHTERVRRFIDECASPEEFAAKHGRNTLVWSYGSYLYSDPEVERWAKRAAECMFSEHLLAECEDRYLVGTELEAARKARERNAKREARQKRRDQASK